MEQGNSPSETQAVETGIEALKLSWEQQQLGGAQSSCCALQMRGVMMHWPAEDVALAVIACCNK